MSELYRPAFADPHYGLIQPIPNIGYLLAAGPGTPTGLSLPAAGYAPGAIFIDRTNANVYRNTGSLVTAVWTLMVGASDIVAALTVTALTVTNAVALASGSTINGIAGFGNQAPVAIAAATTTLTLTPAAHANRLVTVASTGGLAITPPAATGTGNMYMIAVAASVTGGNVTLDAKAGNASDVFYGIANTNKVGTGLTQYGTAANSNLVTWDGSTKGGIKGDFLEIVDVATNVWALTITGQQSGTVATPFSNH